MSDPAYRREERAALRRHAAEQCKQNRDLVLAHPDIARRLTEHPYHLARPDQWSGYIPGRFEPPGAQGVTRINASPIRTQLLAILEAAAEADDAAKGRTRR